MKPRASLLAYPPSLVWGGAGGGAAGPAEGVALPGAGIPQEPSSGAHTQ